MARDTATKLAALSLSTLACVHGDHGDDVARVPPDPDPFEVALESEPSADSVDVRGELERLLDCNPDTVAELEFEAARATFVDRQAAAEGLARTFQRWDAWQGEELGSATVVVVVHYASDEQAGLGRERVAAIRSRLLHEGVAGESIVADAFASERRGASLLLVEPLGCVLDHQ